MNTITQEMENDVGLVAGSFYDLSSNTERILPAGSLNQAISGPPPLKIPFSSVSRLP